MTKEQIIQQGAEAVLIKKENVILKRRVRKGYRIPEMDEKIRKLRTRGEAKLLEKAGKIINVPRVLKVDEKTKEIDMEFIEGLKLSDSLDVMENWREVCFAIGENIAKLHDVEIIHGDLTTSNMIWNSPQLSKAVEDNSKIGRQTGSGVKFIGARSTLLHHPAGPSGASVDDNIEDSFGKLLIELKKLNFSRDEYAVFGSGPMAIRGIKDSGDLDIIVKPKLWKKLIKNRVVKDGTYEKLAKIEIGSIEIYKNWKPLFEDSDKLIDDADIFDGLRFVKLENVLKWKKKYNREKDKKDVELIEKYLSEHGLGRLYFIDFGLGFANGRTEDKAVDLYLIKEALEAKHFLHWEKFFKAVLEGYKMSKNWEETLKRLEKVEKRGRYKQNY